ncbi:MAG: 30S ribosomal protein S12 methylthiotransferase RimO [Lachnospiraceae bacterium]|nr:30S ribosomal protein S12 methylthiotransferase RimO [Lachnospiraceae bacterium]
MKLLMVSLGCDKNLVDSERMLGILTSRGFTLTDDEEEAEVAVINTCCFIEDAKKESIERIFDLARLKETGSLKVLIAAGCMAQRYRDEILEEIPEIDAIVGTTAIGSIAQAVSDALHGSHTSHMRDIDTDDPDVDVEKRVVTTGGYYAYLKIAEGCDKCCTYCAIPKFRGHFRSTPMEKLISEAGRLAERGVRELILVAQETTIYGTDIYGEKRLHVLLGELCRIEGIRWIRILYCYPEEIYPELIDVMAEEPKICHYLDLPIQHASDVILKRMARKTTEEDLRALIGKLRERIPDIALRTTLITGFPGETEEDHAVLLNFVREMRFDRLGVFTYSREEGTPAAAMKNQIKKTVRKKRYGEIMALQQGISLACNTEKVGTLMDVIVEGSLPEDGVYVGRSYRDAPSVDGFVFFKSHRDLMSGDFVSVRITAASEYDLHGEEADK